jgi:tetrahydromethanopterin S-methyltransferase subunit H
MLDVQERNIIRRYLDAGMTPEAIANYIGRLSDLETPDILLIRSEATDMLAAAASPAAASSSSRPVLTLIPGAG